MDLIDKTVLIDNHYQLKLVKTHEPWKSLRNDMRTLQLSVSKNSGKTPKMDGLEWKSL